MGIELTEDDKLWRKQFVPKVSDRDFKKIIEVLGGDGKGNDKDKGKGKQDDKEKDKEREPKKKPIPIKKYSENGKGPLFETIVIGGVPKLVTLDKDHKPQLFDKIERTNDMLVPGDTIDTQNPIPFIFESKEELESCLEKASKCDLDMFFLTFESINRKFVDIEEHYHVLLTADMIWTWLQDRFGYTHYNIFTGDNGSGKNSQLLSFKFLGYRVFYVVSASAPNYYTKMGNVEEGQITVAEDEADDIANDKEKKNIFTSGYSSGGSVPKVELEGGRRSDDWLTYSQKWLAMEELPDNKKIKAILDRSFVLRFVPGHVKYNIKDVIRSAGDPKFKPLYDELIETRKLMFCWRLLHYQDPILDLNLNVENRSAELTKPLIRLFQNSPIALARILDSLTKFMIERNEIKQTSFESKLHDVISLLINERKERIKNNEENEEDKALDLCTFTNQTIRDKCIVVMEGEEIPDKVGVFYSVEADSFSQARITSISKSKFKAKSIPKRLNVVVKNYDDDGKEKEEVKSKTFRCLEYQEEYLNRIKINYNMPEKIQILPADAEQEQEEPQSQSVTPVTLVTPFRGVFTPKESVNDERDNRPNTLLGGVTAVTSVTSSNLDFPAKCYRCDFTPNNKQQYDDHCSLKHRGFSGYPNKAGLDAYGLKPQNKDWEI